MREDSPMLKKYGLWGVLCVALLLRLLVVRHVDYANFAEEYRDYHMVSQIAHGISFPLLGPPSMVGGFHFPSHYYYSMVPLFVLSGFHPIGLLFTGALLSVVSVYALYKLLLLWSGNNGLALTGALLSALSVYSLHLVSYTSNPNFLPVCVLWFLYYLAKILQGSVKQSDYLHVGFAYALASCLHVTATVELPLLTVIALIITRTPIKWRLWGRALLAVLIVYIPYLYYEFTHGFSNTLRLFHLGVGTLHGELHSLSARMVWNFWQGTLTPFNYWYGYTTISPNWLYWIVAVCMAVLCVALLWALIGKSNLGVRSVRFSKAGAVLLWLWIAVPAGTLLMYNRAAHDHYMIIAWPAPVIVLTWLVFWIKGRFGVYAPTVVLLVVVSILQIYSFIHIEHQPWSSFREIYEAQYKNNPNISEIGAVW